MRLRERLDAFPTHKWMARLLPPVYLYIKLRQDSLGIEDALLIYLVWLSEVTMHESWLARREVEAEADEHDRT